MGDISAAEIGQDQQMIKLFPDKYRILIVDDTAFNIMGLRVLLENENGVIIDEVYNGQQALDKIEYSI